MAEQANLNIDPNAAAPAEGATPAAQAAPAPKPKNRQVQPPAKRKGVIEIPQAAFKARVQREAAALIRQQTGKTIEEAIAIVKAGGVVPAGGGQSAAANTAANALVELRRDNEKLRKTNERLTREGDQKVKHLEKKLRQERDARVEAELLAEARIAGITDPDYAVTLFARAVTKDATLQPKDFFTGLKKTKAHLFEADVTPPPPPPAASAPPDTAPPESAAQGEVRPKPTDAGGPPKEANAEDMSPQEFAAHQRRYGFVPGQA